MGKKPDFKSINQIKVSLSLAITSLLHQNSAPCETVNHNVLSTEVDLDLTLNKTGMEKVMTTHLYLDTTPTSPLCCCGSVEEYYRKWKDSDNNDYNYNAYMIRVTTR